MKVKFHKIGRFSTDVSIERLGSIGEIRVLFGVCRFRYTGDTWMKLTYEENTAVLNAIKEPVALMNVTWRLTR